MTEAEKFEAWLGRLGREYDERNVYGVTWVGTPNAMPRYRGQWTEGLWLGWQARAALSLPDVQPALASATGPNSKMREADERKRFEEWALGNEGGWWIEAMGERDEVHGYFAIALENQWKGWKACALSASPPPAPVPAAEPSEALNLHDLVPPSAHDWAIDGGERSDRPLALSGDWMAGWDACRNRTRVLVRGCQAAISIGRLSSPQPAPIPAPEAPTNAWKDAVIDACVVNWIEWDVNDPRKSVATLVEASIKIALDPDVSEQAQALVDHGKSLAAPEAQPSSTEGGAQPSEREAFDAVVSYQSDPKGLALDYWRAAVAWARGSAAHPLPVAVEPAGWKLVPIEPTVEMRNAFHAVSDTLVLGAAGTHWAAMLAASPAPPEQPPT